VTEEMLSNMFVGKPAGNTDRILDFSEAVTGSLFFVPTTDFLDDPPEGPSAARQAATPGSAEPTQAAAAPGTEQSLGIGSLKGRSS
jgi:porphyrinogen peroxidase